MSVTRELRSLRRIYLSHPSKDLDAAERCMDLLVAEGYSLEWDWVKIVRSEKNTPTGKYPKSQLRRLAKECIDHASECSALVAATRDGKFSRGCYMEIGAALATGKFVLIVSNSDHFIFNHPRVYLVKTWNRVVPKLDNIFGIK